MNFMNNHTHTEGSNLRAVDSIIKTKDLITRSVELGYKGVAITDHECLSMHVPALQIYKELKGNGKIPADFKLALGNEIYLVDSLDDVKNNYVPGVTKYWHFILIAKDKEGHELLRRISSESAWENYFVQSKVERVPTVKSELENIIGENKGHLIASTACLGGELPASCLAYFRDENPTAKKEIHQFITWCINVFGKDNFFLELQPPALSGSKQSQTQGFVNKCLVKLANAYGLNYQVTTDAHYLNKEHRPIHEAYLKSDGRGADRELGDFYETTYLMAQDEIEKCLAQNMSTDEIKKAFEGTMQVYNLVEDYDLGQDVIVPVDEKIPEFEVGHIFKDWYERCPYIAKYAYSDNIQERYFLYLCEQGFIKKEQPFENREIERINTEIKELWEISEKIGMRLAAYYVLVRGLIHNIMWNVSYVGVARGSVTGFYTAYLMEITQLNPLKYDLPHWRHLSAERPELPDIDIDTEASKRTVIFEEMKNYYGKENVLNTITFKTEGSKSALLTSCRGLGINDDAAHAMADLIPFERGANWSLSDCLYGNEEKERTPVKELINELDNYENLKDTALMIEGLISGRSIHASAAYVFKDGYIKQNSRMKAPNGKDITAFNMTGSDYCGGLKIDVLTIKALDKIHKCVDLLCKYGFMEAQGSIKATYDKYIHPDVLNYTDEKMWKLISDNELIDAFQFDSLQGIQVAKAIKPASITELATANSLMRLMANPGEEAPMDTYIRNKADINNWYKEMTEYGLTADEIKILEPYLLSVYGVAETQEVVMKLSMDKNIAGFSVAEANKLRKAIAKKKPQLLEETRQKFFAKGHELGTSEKMLDYVWFVQFKKSFGYSFSQNHTLPYSCICLQEMNLAYFYPKIFWNTACLTINAEADEDSDKATDYGKIATAIGMITAQGQKVVLPDINRSEYEFTPDVKGNEILYNFKAINGVSDNLISIIISERPFNSFEDFYNKIKSATEKNKISFAKNSIVSLIKAGCFRNIEYSETDTMRKFLVIINPPVTKLKVNHLPVLEKTGCFKNDFAYRVYKFRQYVLQPQNICYKKGKTSSTWFYKLDTRYALPFFYEHFEQHLKEGTDYEIYDDTIAVKRGSLEKITDKLYVNDFKESTFNSPELIEKYNSENLREQWNNIVDSKYNSMSTDEELLLSKWEMESVNFYYHKHELSEISNGEYLISNFFKLPKEPEIIGYYKRNGYDVPRFELTRIIGTVIDKTKNKHIVTLLTPDGVVNVKFYKGQFVFYDKQISQVLSDGRKQVIEKSWFTRGNMLMITGMRRGEQFAAKKYQDSVYKHTVQLITDVTDGTVTMRSERSETDEERFD